MNHRADIDGLRAVAIIPVVLFHAGISRVPGGFAGVDVFFVISGYLITGLILNDIATGRFSIAHFYERRVRRILPALFFVLIFTSIAAYVFLMPDDAREFGRSLFATMLFSSNLLFAKQTGYFQTAAEMKPLLHTWSLAVEEQFYILYPLSLFVITRYLPKRYVIVLFSLLGSSLAVSVWDVHWHRSVAFYSSAARAWELLAGGILAVRLIPPIRSQILADILAFLGLLLLIGSFLLLSGSLPFPGLNALYPVIGATLLLYSGTTHATIASRILSTKPFVFIGLISYSLYLWHWVLIFFFRYHFLRPLRGWYSLALISVAVTIATVSWRFVENPFRGHRRLVQSRKLLFAGAAAGSAVFVVFASVLFLTHGLPTRLDKSVVALLASKNDYWSRRDSCIDRICRIGDDKVTPSFMLWGDSHAGAIAPVFEQIAGANGISGFIAFSPACAPLLGLKRYDEDDPDKCNRFNRSVLTFIESSHIRNVFLHARWGLYAEGSRYGQEQGGPALLTSDRNPKADYGAFAGLLRTTIAELNQLDTNIIIVASVPEVRVDVPTALARTSMTGKSPTLVTPYSEFMSRQERTLGVLSAVAQMYTVQLVYPDKLICDEISCATTRENHVLYMDSNHLSIEGATLLAPQVAPLLKDVPKHDLPFLEKPPSMIPPQHQYGDTQIGAQQRRNESRGGWLPLLLAHRCARRAG
jgi:peptidoglycan/LPS O-acetylase OafA/YrhL